MSRARKAAFNVFVTLSLILLAILPLGYAASFGVGVIRRPALTGSSIITLELDRGRVDFFWDRDPPTSLPPSVMPGIPLGFTVRGIGELRWPPEWRRAIWEFDAHVLRGSLTRPGQWTLLLACPIWCVAALCMVFPAIWWRRRQRARAQGVQGFAVLDRPGLPDTTATPA